MPIICVYCPLLKSCFRSVFYKEFRNQTALELGIFITGVAIAASGVMLISLKSPPGTVITFTPRKDADIHVYPEQPEIVMMENPVAKIAGITA